MQELEIGQRSVIQLYTYQRIIVLQNYPERFPYVSSDRITGTTVQGEWTQLTVEIDSPPVPLRGSGTALQIILRQDGTGTTWFDDLDVEVLSNVSATQQVGASNGANSTADQLEVAVVETQE